MTTASTPCCPLCSAPLPDAAASLDTNSRTVVAGDQSVQLPRAHAELLQVLAEAYPRFKTQSDIHSRMYAFDPNGGPELQIINVYACKLRAALKPLGIGIGTLYQSGYRLDQPVKITTKDQIYREAG